MNADVQFVIEVPDVSQIILIECYSKFHTEERMDSWDGDVCSVCATDIVLEQYPFLLKGVFLHNGYFYFWYLGKCRSFTCHGVL